ncbi:MAG: pyridoxal-phosphate dependent enzyme, partial [Armatimonadetes bacterium]|nr:pyridoxal-phosphate dependent enzyme [Armatimonadota bacterium]
KNVLRLRNGGSVPLGAYGYLIAGEEAASQADAPFDFAVTPSSSGGTHAGLGYFYHRSITKLVGVACDPENGQYERLVELSDGLDEITGLNKGMKEQDFDVRFGYYGPGYGVPGEQGDAAMDYLMRKEGILLDPIYSGKTFAGLMDLVKTGEIGGRVLFWHTGGLPTLFAGG